MMKTPSVILLLLGFVLSPANGADVRMFNTLADLAAWVPSTLSSNFTVRSFDASRPFASARPGHYDPTSSATTNLGCVYATSTGVGRNLMDDCNGGEVDATWFGAAPFQSSLMTPWAYQTNIAAIGTGDFSVWARLRFPASFSQPMGFFSLQADPATVTGRAIGIGGAFCFRATPSVFGFLARSTNGSSTPGTTVDDAAIFNTNTPSAFSAYYSQTVDFVFTRSGTTVHAYLNGANVDALLNIDNANGFSKSVANGESLLVQIGAQENQWYWPKPVTRFALWTSALSAGQAADPDAVAGKTVDYTPEDGDEPIDNGAAIQAAVDYVAGKGGGNVRLGPGKYSLTTGVALKSKVNLIGSGAARYPSAGGNAAYSFGSTVLVPWFNSSLDCVSVARDDMPAQDLSLTQRTIAALGGTTSARFAFSTIRDVAFFGSFAHDARGIFLDRVGGVEIDGCSFVGMPGYNIYSTVGNVINVLNCSGTGGKSVNIRGAADSKLIGNFLDGQSGPSLWLYGNLNVVQGNVFEVSVNPASGASPWKDTVVADASADTLTVSLAQGHRLRAGDVVRFTSDGTLPAPLITNTDYFVSSSTTTAFKVYTNYLDDLTGTGALAGTGAIDITDTGTGTHYVYPGPAVGFYVVGDNNQLNGNISHFNYEDGLLLDAARWNSVVGNSFVLNGYNNALTNDFAGVRLINGSAQNRVVGNGVDDRNQTGSSQAGVITDATSTDNYFSGNSVNVTAPYNAAADNFRSDQENTVFRYPYQALYIPRSAGFAAQDPSLSSTDASAIQFDSTNRRLLLSDSAGAGVTSWKYAVTYDYEGPWYWNAGAGTTLSAVNTSTAGVGALNIDGLYADSLVGLTVASTNAAQGVRLTMLRNRAATRATYGQVASGDQLGEIVFQGYTFTNGSGASSASIEGVAGSDWTTNTAEGRINLRVTPAGTTARVTQIQVMDQGRIAFTTQAADPTNAVANAQVYFSTANGLTQRRGGAWETLARLPAGGASSNVFRGDGTFTNVVAGPITVDSITYSATNLYNDHIFQVSTLNPVGPLTGPTIVDTSGANSQSIAAVFNTGDVCMLVDQMDHTWVPETTIYPHFHIEPQTAGALTNTVICKYSVADIGGTFPAWTIVTNTVVIAGSQQWKHVLMSMPTNGISMAGKTGPSTAIKMRCEWTTSGDVHVISADIHYRVRGSPVAYSPP